MLKKIHERKFLNPKGSADSGIAELVCELEVEKVEKTSYFDVNIDLTLWDCSRKINLDLGGHAYSRKDMISLLRKRRVKIDKLRAMINKASDFLDESIDFIEKNH